MYQQCLGAVFFAKRAAETAHRGYAILIRVRMLAWAPQSTVQSLHYPGNLPPQFFEEFREFMRSTFARENKLRADKNQTLWNTTINVRDEQRKRGNRGAGRAPHASTRELVLEYLQSDGSRRWEARTRAGTDL